MKIATLLYHDVLSDDAPEGSGFPGRDADSYKLAVSEFDRHLSAIREITGARAVSVFDVLGSRAGGRDFLLTFDDGGSSAAVHIAPMLERYGWRGHFFITSDYIGKPGFLTRADIKALRDAGHVIGSHSCSHPPMMSRCSRDQLFAEWRDSVTVLSDIVGSAVTTASIPGGFYSRAVEETAVEAGIRILFTSEPAMSISRSTECVLLGRFSVQRGTTPEKAAALASSKWSATVPQVLFWNAKKPVKALGGSYWLRFRKAVFNRFG